MVNSTSIETDIVLSLLNEALESTSKTKKQFDLQILQKIGECNIEEFKEQGSPESSSKTRHQWITKW
jgi:hypothetical protein